MTTYDHKSNKNLQRLNRIRHNQKVLCVVLKLFSKFFDIIFKNPAIIALKMGTSMTVPDSVKERLVHKVVDHQNRATADKMTIQKGKNMLDKLSKLSIEAQLGNQQTNKLKDQPETAITEQNQLNLPNQDIELREIQLQMFQTNIPIKFSNGDQQPYIQHAPYSIWQNMTEQTKSHFKRVDQKRKKTLKTKSCYNPAQNQPKKDENLSCVIQPTKKHKILSDIHSDKANELFLSIDSKFGHNIQTKQVKQTLVNQEKQYKQEVVRNIVKKKLLLPNVQIVNSTKEKRKLKYMYQNQEIRFHDDQNWRATS